jgi:hypothetical protein
MKPLSTDGRPSLADLQKAYDRLVGAGWRKVQVAEQRMESGLVLPICAYFSRSRVSRIVLGGIHGREPAGAIALAQFVDRFIELGCTRSILAMPLLNPWGYHHHQRYGPGGQSVSDSDHWLGRAPEPACPEAAAITAFVMEQAGLTPGAAVLDLHEDPIYEAPGYQFEGQGSYFYATGTGAAAHPITQRMAAYLRDCPLPLVMNGLTRFGEALDQGMIVDSEDGSIDELLAKKKGCTPVLTTELVLKAENNPPLPDRIAVYLGLLNTFFED